MSRPDDSAPRLAPQVAPRAPLLTLKEVAHALHLSVRTVKAWRASGRLRVLVLGPRCLRVEQAELDRLLREARS